MLIPVIRILKFGFTGALGMLLDFVVTWCCKEKLRWNKYLSNAIGFSVAVTNNYLLNRFWTFQSTNMAVAAEFLRFLLIAVVGLLLNTAIVYLLTQKKRLPFYTAKLAAVAIVFIWNYTANSLLTFV
jgi:putative flippase GtrA